MEKIPRFEDQKSFESYMRYFSLTEEDLQQSILDVGAGSGDFIEYVRTKFDNVQAFAVEKQQRRISLEKTGYLAADGMDLPFQDNTFKIVIAKNYLPIFAEKPAETEKALLELIRVTKSGGKIMADIPTPENESRKIEENSKREEPITSVQRFQKRLEEAKKLQHFLEKLIAEGFEIDLRKEGKDTVIAIIQKPQKLQQSQVTG